MGEEEAQVENPLLSSASAVPKWAGDHGEALNVREAGALARIKVETTAKFSPSVPDWASSTVANVPASTVAGTNASELMTPVQSAVGVKAEVHPHELFAELGLPGLANMTECRKQRPEPRAAEGSRSVRKARGTYRARSTEEAESPPTTASSGRSVDSVE